LSAIAQNRLSFVSPAYCVTGEDQETWMSSGATKSEKAPQVRNSNDSYKGLFSTSLFWPELTVIPLLLIKREKRDGPIFMQEKRESFSGVLKFSRGVRVFTAGLRSRLSLPVFNLRYPYEPSRILGLGLEDAVLTPSWSDTPSLFRRTQFQLWGNLRRHCSPLPNRLGPHTSNICVRLDSS